MTSLLCCFLLTVSPAMAQANFSIEALLDDTGSPVEAPPAPTALWPTATTIDQVYQTLTIDWAAEPDESLPFAAILQIEHARAWEAAPEELFVVFQDGRRVLLSRGEAVPKQVDLMRAWLAQRMVELPVGDGHEMTTSSRTNPRLILAAAGTQLSVGHLTRVREAPKQSALPDTVRSKRSGSCTNCIDKRDIDRAVKLRMDKIRGCYQRARQRDPGLSGELVVRFEVSGDGTIGTASIKHSSLENSAVEACVREQFLLMKFTRPPGNKTVSVNYPIVFSPGS